MIERLDEYVHSLVEILVSTARKEVERSIEVERIAWEEVPHRELVDPLLVFKVEVLELVQCGELMGVQSVWKNEVWLATKEVLRLAGGNFAYRCEYVRRVSCCSLNRILAPDHVVTRGFVCVDPWEVVVEVRIVRGDVPAELCRVSGKNR